MYEGVEKRCLFSLLRPLKKVKSICGNRTRIIYEKGCCVEATLISWLYGDVQSATTNNIIQITQMSMWFARVSPERAALYGGTRYFKITL